LIVNYLFVVSKVGRQLIYSPQKAQIRSSRYDQN
jgi:hypothetical protein